MAHHPKLPLPNSPYLPLHNYTVLGVHQTVHWWPHSQVKHCLQPLPLLHKHQQPPGHSCQHQWLLAKPLMILVDPLLLLATCHHPLLPTLCPCFPLMVFCLLVSLPHKLRDGQPPATSHHGPSDHNIVTMFTQPLPTSLESLVGTSGRSYSQVTSCLRVFCLLDL